MITNAMYGREGLVGPVVATTNLVSSGMDMNNNKFVDPSKSAANAVTIWDRRNQAGNQGQVASGCYQKFVANEGLATEEAYEISANLALKFDGRYATAEQKAQVISNLLSFLLSKVGESEMNYVRLCRGEL